MFKINGLKFADTGYYVNLDKSTDRKARVEGLVKKYNIEGLNRFAAFTDPLHQYSCTKSHRGAIKEALDANCETVFIAEDDFNINDYTPHYPNLHSKPFFEHLKIVHEDLQKINWDIFLFGCSPRANLIPHTPNLVEVSRSTGAWAYIIKKHIMEYILQKFNYHSDYQAIDNILPLLNVKGFRTLTALPLLIHHAPGLVSTLQPGLGPVDYTNFIEGYYGKFLLDSVAVGEDYVEKYYFEREVAILINGEIDEDFLPQIRQFINNIPIRIKKCKVFLYCIQKNKHPQELIAYFRDRPDILNIQIELFNDYTSLLKTACNNITSPYFLLVNPKYIFTSREVEFDNILNLFKDKNLTSLSFNIDTENIDNTLDLSNISGRNIIPNTVTLISKSVFSDLVYHHDNFFDKDLGFSCNSVINSFKLGILNFNNSKTVAEEKTSQYILEHPLRDH